MPAIFRTDSGIFGDIQASNMVVTGEIKVGTEDQTINQYITQQINTTVGDGIDYTVEISSLSAVDSGIFEDISSLASTNGGSSNNTTDISSLSAVDTVISGDLSSLAAIDSTTNLDISSLSAVDSGIFQDISSLAATNGGSPNNTADISSLSAVDTAISGDLSSLAAIDSAVDSDISSLSAVDSQISGDLSSLAAIDSTTDLDISSLSAVDTLISGDLSSLAAIDSATDLDISSLSAVDAAMSGDISSLAALESQSSNYNDTDVANYLDGNLNADIIPATNSTYDIGSAEKKIRHLYLSNNSLYIGGIEGEKGTQISATPEGAVVFPSGINITGNIDATEANINFGTIGDTPPSVENNVLQWNEIEQKWTAGDGLSTTINTLNTTTGDLYGFYKKDSSNIANVSANLTALNFQPTDIPTSKTSAGSKGQITYDENYVYLCVADNTWKRLPSADF